MNLKLARMPGIALVEGSERCTELPEVPELELDIPELEELELLELLELPELPDEPSSEPLANSGWEIASELAKNRAKLPDFFMASSS